MGRQIIEDRYHAQDHFLTPEVLGLDAGCCVKYIWFENKYDKI